MALPIRLGEDECGGHLPSRAEEQFTGGCVQGKQGDVEKAALLDSAHLVNFVARFGHIVDVDRLREVVADLDDSSESD